MQPTQIKVELSHSFVLQTQVPPGAATIVKSLNEVGVSQVKQLFAKYIR